MTWKPRWRNTVFRSPIEPPRCNQGSDMSDPYKPVQTWSCCRGEACLARPSLEHSRPVEDHIDRSALTKIHLVPMAGYGGYHDCGRANREPNACACLSSRD